MVRQETGMQLELTGEHVAFRDRLRAWLADNVPHQPLPAPGTPDGFAAHRDWERRLAAAGYAALHWPTEHGGAGADPVTQAIFEEEYVLAGGPERVAVVGHNLLGPTLMAYGTDEQRRRWLPATLSAEIIWSQGYSEPDAGSDLASVRTRATRDGDHLVVNGQKIWTSYGAYADWIFALVRTDPDAPRHDGITFVLIDLSSPGVEARPITQVDGHAGFAEVFFTDVRVPVDQVVGEVGDGWRVAMTALGFERDAPAAAPARYRRDLDELVALARELGHDRDPVVRDRLAALDVDVEAYRAHAVGSLLRLQRGESIGPASSVTKLLWSHLERRIHETRRELLGPEAELDDDRDDWRSRYWYARAATIYAGTSEIQRTIVAQRVLGLPRGGTGRRAS